MLDKKALSQDIRKNLDTVDPNSEDNKDTWDVVAGAIVNNFKHTVEVNTDFLPHVHDRQDIRGLTFDDISGITAYAIGLGNVTNESKATMFTGPVFTGSAYADTLSANGLSAVYVSGETLGINNTILTNGKGLSLYNGPADGKPTYGLMFAGTSTFGTHGDVTGGAAVYFTINRDDTRGWIFKSSDASDTTGNYASISGRGYIYGAKVYGAVYNDIADFIEADEEAEFGYVYCRDSEGKIRKTSKKGQHALGIASDTFGFSMGKIDNKCQIPIALGGWALAYLDKIYPFGTPLVATKNGKLTKASIFTKSYNIVAFFDREEKNEMWHDVEVKGRHWVKVVG